jgi:hypothetical protein
MVVYVLFGFGVVISIVGTAAVMYLVRQENYRSAATPPPDEERKSVSSPKS